MHNEKSAAVEQYFMFLWENILQVLYGKFKTKQVDFEKWNNSAFV